MDAVSRARALLDGGATAEEVVRDLRAEGFSVSVSTLAVMTAAGMSHAEVMQGVMLEGPIFSDRRVSFDRWTHLPVPLDEETLDRLRQVCRGEPRIVEGWVTGSRLTRLDGSSSESTDIAVILEPAFVVGEANDADWELADRLVEAAVPGGPGSWFFTTKEILEAHAEQCSQIYPRAQGGEQA